MNSGRVFKRALITGIKGSGGSYLREYIEENHHEVEVYGIHRGNCDLEYYREVYKILDDTKPDVIFHLASNADVRASFDYPGEVLRNNIVGTCNLFEAVKNLKLDPIIQHCSTSEVYGQVDPKNVPITEDCHIKPVSPYAISKTAQDFLAQTYYRSYGLKIIITRMFAYINPRRTNLFASSFANQIVRIEKGLQKELTYGNLDSVRTLIDVRDAMRAYWEAAKYCEPGEIYNIGGTSVMNVGDFLRELIRLAKAAIPTRLDKNLLRPTDVTLQIPNTDKFYEATGFIQKYNLKESMEFLLNYFRVNSDNI